jgi:hypothetical protein
MIFFMKQELTMIKLLLTFLLMTTGIYALPTNSIVDPFISKGMMYVDGNDLKEEEGSFRIHIGGNVWVQTNTMHRDCTGLYTYESEIKMLNGEYQRTWKCPYCHLHWPIGKSCKNKDCPSKYKDDDEK